MRIIEVESKLPWADNKGYTRGYIRKEKLENMRKKRNFFVMNQPKHDSLY